MRKARPQPPSAQWTYQDDRDWLLTDGGSAVPGAEAWDERLTVVGSGLPMRAGLGPRYLAGSDVRVCFVSLADGASYECVRVRQRTVSTIEARGLACFSNDDDCVRGTGHRRCIVVVHPQPVE
jgi:hypothetical protein